MKYIRIVYYVLRQSVKNILRNLFMVFASVVVVFFVLLVVGIFIEAGLTLGSVIEQFSDRAEIQINFSYIVSDETAKEYFDVISKDTRVKTATYITKEENLNRILDYFKDDKELFENYRNSERLQFVSIEVQLNHFEDGTAFVNEIKQLDGIDSVKDIVETVDKMELTRFWVNVGTITAAVIMTGLSLLLIFNTVKLTVIARHREIEIMKFIGATDVYIATPFILEGVSTGIVGAIIAWIVLSGVYKAVFNFISELAAQTNIVPKTFAESGGGAIFVGFILFGIATGFVASMLAARKYMKV